MAYKWVQKSRERMKRKGTAGSFTRAAARRGKTTRELDQAIQAHPENYSPALRKKDNWFHNVVVK